MPEEVPSSNCRHVSARAAIHVAHGNPMRNVLISALVVMIHCARTCGDASLASRRNPPNATTLRKTSFFRGLRFFLSCGGVHFFRSCEAQSLCYDADFIFCFDSGF
jgi:hypothetical protein